MFDAKQSILDNGIKLVTIKKDTALISVNAGIKIGSIYEEIGEKGISHFVEHMLFKGTLNRDNEKLNNELEQIGGEYNAYTDYNCTVYSITALSSELDKTLEVISDMLINATFPKEEIEKEREVILAEIRTSRDDLEEFSFKRVHEIAYKNSPLKHETIGEEKIIRGFERQGLINFYQQNYIPNNCFISVVSPFEHEEVLDIINKYFTDWKWKEFKRNQVLIEKNIDTKVVSYKSNIEQNTIIYMYTFHGITKDEELALRVLNHKFGESSNSILFRELREERGLAYDVYTQLDLTAEVKSLYIYTAVGEENVKKAMDTIEDCINKIKSQKIVLDEGTITLMKKVLKTAVVFTLEDSTDIGSYVVHQLMDGENIYQFTEDMNRLEKVKKEDIYNIARFVFNNPTIHILKRCD